MLDLFVNTDNSREYLISTRTSQAIGSHITEYYFHEQFLKNDDIKVAKDWCIAQKNDLKFFFVIREKTNDFDLEIANHLEENDKK